MKNFIRALLVGFVFGLLLSSVFISNRVKAAEVDIQGGITQYTKVANGNWYQDGFDHKLNLTAATAGIIILTDKDEYGMQYGFGGGNYGEYSSTAKILNFDANYDANSPTHCNGPCQKLSDMKAWGNIPYFELQARKTFNNGFVFGLSVIDTRASLHATNYNWQATPPYGNTPNPLPPFTVYHQVVNKFDLGLMLGYKVTPNLSVELEFDPTHAPNDQASMGNTGEPPAGQGEYFKLLTKGYSPRVLIEYTLYKF